jgi:hypothetical protein
MKYKVYGQYGSAVFEDIIFADNEEEAIDVAYRMNYKNNLMMKYMDNVEFNSITFEVEEEE